MILFAIQPNFCVRMIASVLGARCLSLRIGPRNGIEWNRMPGVGIGMQMRAALTT